MSDPQLVPGVNGVRCPQHDFFLGRDDRNPEFTLRCVVGCGPYRIVRPECP